MSRLPLYRRISVSVLALLVLSASQAAADLWVGQPLTVLLEALRKSGLNILYSSELVPPTLRISEPPVGRTLRDKTEAALSHVGLRLEAIAPNRFAVGRVIGPARPSELPDDVSLSVASAAVEPLDEVLVYSHRDAGSSDMGVPDGDSTRRVPGSETDALAGLRSLPGIAADTSARPYVRGSNQEDVLIVFDHVPFPDPFHLKNFGNLASVFDGSVIDRVDLYSSGFPVRYGTRSGGVVELTPHAIATGHELVLGAGLSALRVTSAGHSKDRGINWLAAARRSVAGSELLSAGDRLSQPVAEDALARVHWNSSGTRDWTVGMLALDDSINLLSGSGVERVNAGNRSQIIWLTSDSRSSDAWHTRTTLVFSNGRSRRSGDTVRPGLMSGTLDDQRDLDGLSLYNESRLADAHGALWDLGGELVSTSGAVRYSRSIQYDPVVAPTLSLERLGDANVNTSLRSTAYAIFASYARPLGTRFDFELGLRYNGQRYPGLKAFEEWSPRLNLRYRFDSRLVLHGSAGKYTQAQKPDERRFEESQYTPDHPQVLWQESLGLDYHSDTGPLWRLDVYHKHWDRISPYFDDLLNERGLLPELAPFRVRVAPRTARAEGAELSVHSAPQRLWQYWASYSWAMVQDRFGQRSVLRSWDQRSALSSGIDLTRNAFSGTTALRWHSGTPNTSVRMTDAGGIDSHLLLGPRNAGRTGDYISLDLRSTWTHPSSAGDLELWVEMMNSLNHANNCCSGSTASGSAAFSSGGAGTAPRTIDLGALWRFR